MFRNQFIRAHLVVGLALIVPALLYSVAAQVGAPPSNGGIVMLGGSGGSSSGGGAWVLKNTGGTTLVGVNHVDQIGLGTCTDIEVLIIAATPVSPTSIVLLVSIDNGSTFLNTSGDYKAVTSAGVVSDTDSLLFDSAGPSTAAARTGDITLSHTNVSAPKVAHSNIYSTDGIFFRYMPTTSTLNAVRVVAGTGNFSAGTMYVFCR